jgi:hypothetical protein
MFAFGYVNKQSSTNVPFDIHDMNDNIKCKIVWCRI